MERVVEQIIDVQKNTSYGEDRQGSENHAASCGRAVPTICYWRESQDRNQQRTSEQVANTRVQPTVNPVEVRSHFGSSRDPSPQLEFLMHLPSRQPHQHSFRVRFLFAVYIAWPLLLVALSSKCGKSGCTGSCPLCGGIWVYGWEEASHVQDLWENFPAAQRHSLRLLACQK